MREHVIAFHDPGNGTVRFGAADVFLRIETPDDVEPEILQKQIEDIVNILDMTEIEPELESVMDRLSEAQGYAWAYIEPEFTVET